jgi:hypothetical protein
VTEVRALACIECGFVTLHVTDLARLRDDVQKHPELFQWE